MASLNKVQLIGNVGTQPEIRYVGADNPSSKVASFRLATTERYRSRSGEPTEKTEWHSVVAWRGLADTVENYVKKGAQIYVEGRLTTRQWTDKNGIIRYTTEVQADNLFLLGRKPQSEDEGSGYGSPYQSSRQGSYQQPSRQTYSQYQPAQPRQAPSYQTPQPFGDLSHQAPLDQAQQAPDAAPSQDNQDLVGDDLPF